MGLYIGPAISGHEPKFQRFGVNFLFVCLLVIVVGAFTGQWLAVMQKLGLDKNFWFGHQGWEYVDLGRFWQWFLFVGLRLWLMLVGRALWPAIRKGGESKSIIVLLFLSTVCIGLFYGAGLMWGEHTHLSMVEYWRWWVVHLWVEGFFEVFATAVIAFLFTRLGLLRARTATVAVLFATIVFMAGGVLGTLHHLYFTGTPTAVIALGASFSALEVVPLAYIGFEAYHTYKLGQRDAVDAALPLADPVLHSRWRSGTCVGAGLFGFLINPPLPLYYMQGLNLTPLHGHTALFGVYGMLGIGLMLFCLRGLKPERRVERARCCRPASGRSTSAWRLMALLTLLPIGVHAAAARRSSTATGMRARPSSCSSRSSSCWCGCACPATRSSASARWRWPGSCSGCGSRRSRRRVAAGKRADGGRSAEPASRSVASCHADMRHALDLAGRRRAASARRRAAPPAVLRRREQRAARDGWWTLWLVDARWHVFSAAAACVSRGLAARDRDAVPGAAVLHVRLSADGVSALDESAGADAPALRAGRAWACSAGKR